MIGSRIGRAVSSPVAAAFLVTIALSGAARASAQQAPGSAQEPSDLFDAAYQAWDAGDYGVALEGLGDVLERPDASGLLADIAVLTGERYHTLEVAPDGRAPRWSPDGRHAAYDVPGGAPRTVVVAVDDAGVRTVAELDGYGATFSPDGGSIAWLETDDPAALGREQQAIRDTTAVTNRAEWVRLNQALAEARARRAVVHVRDLATGAERELPASEPVYGVAWSEGEAVPWIRPVAVAVSPTGSHLVYQDDEGLAILDLAENWQRTFAGGESPAFSGDGATLVFLARDGDDHVLRRVRLDQRAGETFVPETLFRATDALANPAVSQDGAVVAFQRMGRENWEVWVLEDGEGSVGEVPARAGESDAPRRLTHDVQHDLYPAFLSGDRLLVVKGEGRHRRSYVYPVRAGGEPAVREWVPGSGEGMRLFHNNTVRTVAPEYEWAVSPDGTKVLIVAERDGDTIDPARGLYLTDLDRPVSRDAVRARVAEQLAAERALRETADALFAGTVGDVRDIVADVSVSRIHGYAADLERMGTKYIGNPGNLAAIDYLVERLRSWGYDPELQWFEPRSGIRSANVIARLPGTERPDVTYLVGSHFDSSPRGPGADDNSSGSTALLEAARVLADRPQPATIEFVWFTGEEAGLLGSREYARQAEAAGKEVAAALNNDMVGYANDDRLDNTIRYSSAEVRDLQHAAALLFTDLILYDAHYYKSTDAHALYDAFGDVIGGIGSYPILASPHYHQSHDVLETINQRLVAEVSKATVATMMGMARGALE